MPSTALLMDTLWSPQWGNEGGHVHSKSNTETISVHTFGLTGAKLK